MVREMFFFCYNFLSVPSVRHTDHDGRWQNVLHLSRRVHLCCLELVSGYRQFVLVHLTADFSCKRLISCSNYSRHRWLFHDLRSTSTFSLMVQFMFYNSSWKELVFGLGVCLEEFEKNLVAMKFCCFYYRFQSHQG